MTKDLSYYRGLPYEREWIARDDESGRYFVVRLKDIPEVYGVGHTRQQALSALTKTFDDQIAWCLEEGVEIAEPAVVLERPIRIIEIAMLPMGPPEETGTVQVPGAGESRTSPSASESFGTVEPILVQELAA